MKTAATILMYLFLCACERSPEQMKAIEAAADIFARSLKYTPVAIHCIDFIGNNARCAVRVAEVSSPLNFECWVNNDGGSGCALFSREMKKRNDDDGAVMIMATF